MTAVEAHQISGKFHDHRDFQAWQAAQLMNIIFGAGYVPIPYLPSGYEEYGAAWFRQQAGLCGKDVPNWGWAAPFPTEAKRPMRGL